jgi:hypothetical protein
MTTNITKEHLAAFEALALDLVVAHRIPIARGSSLGEKVEALLILVFVGEKKTEGLTDPDDAPAPPELFYAIKGTGHRELGRQDRDAPGRGAGALCVEFQDAHG